MIASRMTGWLPHGPPTIISSGSARAAMAASAPMRAWLSARRVPRRRFRTSGRAEQPADVDGRGAGLPQAQGAEHLDQGHGLAVRAGGEEVGDLAGEPAMPAADLPSLTTAAAQALAEVDVGEVVRRRGAAAAVAFGPRGPVHVVIDDDRPVDVAGAGSRPGRARRAGTARRAGGPARPVARSTGSAALTTASLEAGAVAADRFGGRGPQRGGGLLGPGRRRLRLCPGDRVAVGVDALGHDALGCDADGERGPASAARA